jgi:hypothetical protein
MNEWFWGCENTGDKICVVVAIIGMFAGMFACGYGMYKLLEIFNVPNTIRLLTFIATAPFVGYCFNRFETIVRRLG